MKLKTFETILKAASVALIIGSLAYLLVVVGL